jgi:cell division protein FtsZ
MFQNRLDHTKPQRNYAIFIAPEETPVAKIKVIGVGGGGCNAVSSMISRGLSGVEFIAVNTDVQSLNACLASQKIQIGASITKGLGTGGKVDVGKKAAEEDRDKILKAIEGAEMVFIATGLGGGTGTGSSPVIAKFAKSTGALVVCVATKPLTSEGNQKMKIAEKGLMELREICDSTIVVPNDNIILALEKEVSAFDGYDKPNEILYNAVKGISDIILRSGTINLDFADVRTALLDSGEALMGIGRASGENKVIEALNKAISSPLLEAIDLRSAHSILVNISGSSTMRYHEVMEAMARIREMTNQNAFIKYGMVKDESLGDDVMVTVVATGYNRISGLIKNDEIGNELKLVTDEATIESNEKQSISFDENNFEDLKYDPDKDQLFEIPTWIRTQKSLNNQELKSAKNSEDQTLYDEIKKAKNDEASSSALLRRLMD